MREWADLLSQIKYYIIRGLREASFINIVTVFIVLPGSGRMFGQFVIEVSLICPLLRGSF
jgi:hypothetical protein